MRRVLASLRPRSSLLLTLFFLLASTLVRDSWQLLSSGLGSDDEVRLVEYLFKRQGYNPLIRPVRNLTDVVTVDLGLAMIQLINVDEKNQIMKSNVWLRMLWRDYQLEWDPSDYGGINVIRILPHKVWKPDIVLFNNADGKYEVSYKPNVVVHANGDVLWIPPAIYKSSCTIDVEFFPFDQQQCEMKFGSWTFNGDQVELDWYEGTERVDLSDYVNSGTWDIIDCPGKYVKEKDEDENHNVAQITFTLFIRRKTLFYTVNLIIPCVLISFLSICVFYLPADAGEKMTMCISILLALVVFLLLVSKILPPTSITIPLIAKYLLFTFIMNIFTILITVIIINWNFRTPRTHRMPKWVRVVFLNYLPRLLFMKRPNHSDRWAKKSYTRMNNPGGSGSGGQGQMHAGGGHPHQQQAPTGVSGTYPRGPGRDNSHSMGDSGGGVQYRQQYSTVNARTDLLELSEIHQHHPNCRNHHKGPEPARPGENHGNGGGGGGGPGEPHMDPSFFFTPETHKAIEAVRFIAAHLKNEDDYAEILEDWRYIAMVIDRLMLYIFLAVTIGGTVGILINAPHIFEYVDQNEIKDRILGLGQSDITKK